MKTISDGQEKSETIKQIKHSTQFMSPVSPVFHTVVTVSIGP